MGTDAILDWFQSVLNNTITNFPTDSPWTAASGASWSMWSTMDYFLPVHELLSVFAVVFALGGPLLITSMLIWVLVGVVRGGATHA